MPDTSLGMHGVLVQALRHPEMEQKTSELILDSLKRPDPLMALTYRISLSLGDEGPRLEYGPRLYFDAPHALTLLCTVPMKSDAKEVPIGCVSFQVTGVVPHHRFFIVQIQGVMFDCHTDRAWRSALSRIRWETLLVRTVMELARRVDDINAVCIRHSHNNEYYVPYNPQKDMFASRNERMRKRYDDTAKECGFTPEPRFHVLTL